MSDTVQQVLRERAADHSTGLKHADQEWSWAEYVAEASRRANLLLGRHRGAGDGSDLHVGVLLANTPEMVLALGAGALGGYVTAGINETRRGPALARDVLKADCRVLLTDDEHLPLLDGLELPGVEVVNTDSADWAAAVAEQPAEVAEPRQVDAFDPFMLIFTSGTSGDPKAVKVSNFMVVMSGANLTDRFGLGADDVCYLSMPLFHSNAVLSGYAVAAYSGAAMALARRFSASHFLDDVRRYGATYVNYVGKPLAYVLATPRRPDDADNPLKFAFGNEASERDIDEFAERFGCRVVDAFGSTETAIIIQRVDGTPKGSIGQPWDSVAVFNRSTGEECPRAEFDEHGRVTNLDEAVGELVNTQGAGFFAGYYNDEEATSERLSGGMFWSGDLAYRDKDGFVFLAGRTSDWLRVDGENLAAAPIEGILMRHPAVNRVAVYAVPDERVGDQLVAAIVLNDEPALDPAGFELFLAEQPDLSPKAWPRYVRLATDLPSTATNKVLKRELVAQGLDVDDLLWERAERGTSYAVRGAPVGV
ncbi:fatty-acid--CoA ligase FadD1 [Nocardioides ferulae]|uniref:fatty-acid--CoA ligase FadD1 n=1 Tax=Nocardioides ferulae TaxID=2340821 RepID=UPI000EADCBC1|nr:fatty-acid--CoA ligase FadD1 [Nocardioides ferulae]